MMEDKITWYRQQKGGTYQECNDSDIPNRGKLDTLNIEFPGAQSVTHLYPVVEGKTYSNGTFRSHSRSFSFRNCRFEHCIFTSDFLQESQYIDCTFENCTYSTNEYGTESQRSDGRFLFLNCKIKCFLSRSAFVEAKFIGSQIESTTLPKRVVRSTFEKTTILESSIQETTFLACKFNDVDLLGASLSSATRFEGCLSTSNLRMTKHQLSYLSKSDSGGLTPSQLSDMDIIDELKDLRLAFGGYWRILHWIGMLAFIYPYLVFCVIRILETQFVHGALWESVQLETLSGTPPFRSMAFGEAIWNFFLSGGKEWQQVTKIDVFWILSTIVFGVYNLARAVLVFKSLQLESIEHVTGIPPEFSVAATKCRYDKSWLDRFVSRTIPLAWSCYQTLSYLAVAAVIVNTFKFLLLPVVVR